MGTQLPDVSISSPQGAGPFFGEEPGYMWATYMNRCGAATAVGDVLQVDFLGIATETTTADNAATSIFGSAITPRAGFILGREGGIALVCLEIAADNAAVKCAYFGKVQAMVIGAGGSGSFGDDLVVTTAKNFDLVAATGERIFGSLIEDATTVTARELHLVFLDNGMKYCSGIQAQTAG